MWGLGTYTKHLYAHDTNARVRGQLWVIECNYAIRAMAVYSIRVLDSERTETVQFVWAQSSLI